MSKIDKKTVAFAKLDPEAIIPQKRLEDAGYDVYALDRKHDLVLGPHQTTIIRTGIASVFHKNYACCLMERGSTGTKGIGQRAGVIDSGYRGEWMVPLTNHNDKPILFTKDPDAHRKDRDEYAHIYPWSKAITQAVFLRVPALNVQEIDPERLLDYKSARGDGNLGSSGK